MYHTKISEHENSPNYGYNPRGVTIYLYKMAGRRLAIYFAASIRAGRGDAGIYSKLVTILKTYGTVLTEHVGSSELGTFGKVLCVLASDTRPGYDNISCLYCSTSSVDTTRGAASILRVYLVHFSGETHLSDKEIHDRDMSWLMQSDGESLRLALWKGIVSVCEHSETQSVAALLSAVIPIATAVLVAEVTQPSLGVGYEIGRAVEHQKRVLCLFRKEAGQSEHYPTTTVDTIATEPSPPISLLLSVPLPTPSLQICLQCFVGRRVPSLW